MTQSSYKTFRVSINANTLLDDFAPVLINDISGQFQPIFLIKENFCSQMDKNCTKLQAFSEFTSLTRILQADIQKLKNDFIDCEENIDYFTLVFMGAVSAGKTSMICDFLNVNPDQLNQALRSVSNFQRGLDDVVIAGEVATANVYEFLIGSSHIRLVDVPGTGGVVHDNTTLAPFINKADCVIFLSNAQADLNKDDYNFIKYHVVGLHPDQEFAPETHASLKKALIVVNKWNTVVGDLRNVPHDQAKLAQKASEKLWETKKNWILDGDSKKGNGNKFKGLSELFKRKLTIVRASTSVRILDTDDGSYRQFGKERVDLNEVTSALKEILIEEGVQIKLDRPKLILKRSLQEMQETLANEKTKRSIDEMIAALESMGSKVSLDSNQVMIDLISRLTSLQNRLKSDLFYQIKSGISQWQPSVSIKNRVMGLWPKEWWGSDKFGAKAVQDELRTRWQGEIETLLKESIKPDEIRRAVKDEANLISSLLESKFKEQLATLQNQVLKGKLSKGVSLQSFDGSNINISGSSSAIEDAVESAVSEIQRSVVDDIIGIVTVDAVIATLIGAILTPLGSALFLALRRWWSGQAEEKKAKDNLEDEIWRIADEVSSNLQEQVANKLRSSVQNSVNTISNAITGERDSLSKLMKALDDAIHTVKKYRDDLEKLNNLSSG